MTVGLDPREARPFAEQQFLRVERIQRLLVVQPKMGADERLKIGELRTGATGHMHQPKPGERHGLVVLLFVAQARCEPADTARDALLGSNPSEAPDVKPRQTNVIGVLEHSIGIFAVLETAGEFLIADASTAEIYLGTFVHAYNCSMPYKPIEVERVQTGVRLEKRLLKVLKALAELKDLSVGDLLEGIVLHAFEGQIPFPPATLKQVSELKKIYGMTLRASDSHKLKETAK